MLRNASRAIIDDLQQHGRLITSSSCTWIRNNGQDIGFSIKGDRPRVEGKGKTKGDHARAKGNAPIPFQPTQVPPAPPPPQAVRVRQAPSTLQHELQEREAIKRREVIERRDAAFQAWCATYTQNQVMSLVEAQTPNMPQSMPIETVDLLGLDSPAEMPSLATPMPASSQSWTDTMTSQAMSSQDMAHASPPASIEVTQTPLPSEAQAEEQDVNTSACNKIRQE